jgi:hypothetical protein
MRPVGATMPCRIMSDIRSLVTNDL